MEDKNRSMEVRSNKDIHIRSIALDEAECREFVCLPEAGGVVLFIGTVRNHTEGREVVRLEFESRESMALKEMHKIADKVCGQWPIHKVAIHHRVGSLDIGEVAVIIAVSAAHRKAAFEACMYAINTLKETVPIWKKEIFSDGEVWVAAHP